MPAALSVLSAAVCVYAMREVDPDLFGHLAYGRLFAQNHAPTFTDPFSYTSGGRHWTPFEYLAQLLLWTTFDRFGSMGLIGLKVLIGGAAISCLFKAIVIAGNDPVIWTPLFLLGTTTISRFFLFRPQLFTFAFFGLFVAVLVRWILRGRAPLWLLPLATLIWANTHGGFLAGLAIVVLVLVMKISGGFIHGGSGLSAAWRTSVPLIGTLAGCVLATLVNPSGVGLWRYVLFEMVHGTNRRFIAEWGPVSWMGDSWSATALSFIAGTTLITGWLAHRHRLAPAGLPARLWTASCVPLIAAAYVSVRHVPLAAAWSIPVIAVLASELRLTRDRAFPRLWLLVASGSIVPTLLTIAYVGTHVRPAISTSPSAFGTTNPCPVVAFMRENGVRGNVFTPLWWGSYISWEMYPDVRVSMDGRNVSLYSDDLVAENLRFYSTSESTEDSEAPLRRHSDFLLMPSDSARLATVRMDDRWHLLYADADAVLFGTARARESLLSRMQTDHFNSRLYACSAKLPK